MKKTSKKRPTTNGSQSSRKRLVLLMFFIPIIIFISIAIYSSTDIKQQVKQSTIPAEFIPIYEAAEKEYGVPAYLLAAHHRVETIFSTMDPLLSPAGAEGHLQFMPCTFVGWTHPTCEGLGQGEIPEEEKLDPVVIEKYGGYGVDANGDGIADPYDIEDAIFSAANFLSKYGAADGDLKSAVYAYNHSDKYVDDVLYYANIYKDLLN
ncbi:lytic transglycosylase domain-containing protein [Lederbergia lenta]|uniref:M24/M37 family peptidase n=1 Tax=Lederbergia lenta TaxID=1467 RepID=A0A2X4WLC7_LEDLE|nr:lytic transglycosylase domain-containing protein [Lederbergia lenta]MCM3109710.1 lytic transglycosylase domain-containing protein [Lederbergia lenta]MEC2324539.1 lytic transglycosylase domain-containing protein [Lederbergia lenta]SQI59502.1 M24/M37 family peptidase [Lederbergia lenta]